MNTTLPSAIVLPMIADMDSVDLVARLGQLVSTLSGDDRSVETVTMAIRWVMHADAALQSLERRRKKDRERPRNPQKSMESAEIGGSPSLSPTPPFSTPETPRHTAREADRGGMVEVYSAQLDTMLGEVLFADVDAFVKRRPFNTWTAWMREMLSAIGPGSQFLPEDLARVCRDDAALERPLGSPKALRTFLGSAKLERTTGGRQMRGGVGQRAFDTTLDAIKDIA